MTGTNNDKTNNMENNNRFDRAAATWDENQVRVRMCQAVSEKMKERLALSTSMKALEFGCGTGLVTVLMAPVLGDFTAIDSSDNMLDQLRRKIGDMGLSSVTCLKVDIDTENIPGHGYDLIFSNMTAHHIGDLDVLLKKLHEALAEDGILAITDLDCEDGSFHSDMTGVKHLGFRRFDVVSAFERAGFVHCSVEDAHVVEKMVRGTLRRYPMFLAVGLKTALSL